MDELRQREQRRERRPDDAVHAMGAQRAARDVRERDGRIEGEPLEAALPPAGPQRGADRVAGDHDLACRERGRRRGERDGDPVGEPADQPVREAGHDDLLVDQQRQAPDGGGDRRRHGDEPAGRDDHVRAEAAEQRQRPAEARRDPEREIRHVAPRELAAELAGRDRRGRECRPPAPTSPRCPSRSRSTRAGRRRRAAPGARWRWPGPRRCARPSRRPRRRPSGARRRRRRRVAAAGRARLPHPAPAQVARRGRAAASAAWRSRASAIRRSTSAG